MTAILRLLVLLVPLAGLTGCAASGEFIDRVRETAERTAEGETMEQIPDDGGAAVASTSTMRSRRGAVLRRRASSLTPALDKWQSQQDR